MTVDALRELLLALPEEMDTAEVLMRVGGDHYGIGVFVMIPPGNGGMVEPRVELLDGVGSLGHPDGPDRLPPFPPDA